MVKGVKKLIRTHNTARLKDHEWEKITDIKELNRLYGLKVLEELSEVQGSNCTDILEFADLIQVVFAWAKVNEFSGEEIALALIEKTADKGPYGRIALNDLNPDNPSNKIYFEESLEAEEKAKGGQWQDVKKSLPWESEVNHHKNKWYLKTKHFGYRIGFFYKGKFMHDYATEILNVTHWIGLPPPVKEEN